MVLSRAGRQADTVLAMRGLPVLSMPVIFALVVVAAGWWPGVLGAQGGAPAPAGDAGATASNATTATSLIAELLEMSKADMPTAVQLRERLAPRATSVKTSGKNLNIPKWARSTSGANDVFMEMTGDVIGVRLEEDSRGWGAYAELFVQNTSLAAVEKVTGTTKLVPRNPDDFHSGETRAAYVDRGGHHVRIFVELTKDKKQNVQRVLMHFEK